MADTFSFTGGFVLAVVRYVPAAGHVKMINEAPQSRGAPLAIHLVSLAAHPLLFLVRSAHSLHMAVFFFWVSSRLSTK